MVTPRQMGVLGVLSGIVSFGSIAQADGASPASWTASAERPPTVEVVSPASAPMEFAASELARYLGRILGRPIAVGTAAPGRPRILIEKVVDSAPMGDESYEIRAEGNTLRLRAGGDPGAVFGVYEFLRRYGGCRFSGLGPDGELVPTAQRVTADGLPLRMRPKLWYRAPNFFRRGARTEWRGRYTDEESTRLCVEWLDWLVKNGLNYLMYTRDIDEEWFARAMLPEVRKRGVKLDFDNHNLRRWLPPERYFADHPEWFPMVDGKRVARCEQLSMCTSNQGAVQAVIENVKAFLRAHPEMSVVGVMPEDGHGMCHCDACTRLDVANGIDPQEQYRKVAFAQEGKGNRALRRRYTLLVNQVARAVREEFPDVLIASAGYVDLTAPDPEIPLESNTVVWIALFGCDGARPISAESPSKVNRLFYNTMEQWLTRTRGKVVAFSYTMGMSTQCSLPYSMDRVLVDVWKNLKALGIQGAGMHQRPEDHEVYALNVLAVLRSAWQDDVDPDALLDEYLEGMYGSAAGEIRPIYDAFHEAWRRAAEHGVFADGKNIVLQIDALGEARLDECLRRAEAKAANDRERRQVAKLAQAAQYWKAAAQYYRLVKDGRIEDAVLQAAEANAHFNRLPPGWASGLDMMDLFGVPPHITTQPGSRTVARGASASLTVKVLGYLPLTYRWQKDGTDIAGATTASYTLDAVAEDDRGAYRCVIGNRFGSATSAAATLTVTK